MTEPIYLPSATLRDFSTRILTAFEVPEPHALLVSDSLVAANLRGVDSHGVQMLLPYIEQLELGSMEPRSTGRL
ncbi:MAG: Ldh family oxidoreductase, partial [Bryobacteraceae bacterium]